MRILVQNPLCCSSVEVAACVEPFHDEEALESPPIPSRVGFLGILGCCRTRDWFRLASGRTLVCPHLPAAGSDPFISSPPCTGLGRCSHGAGEGWSFDLQMPEEPGQHLKQKGLAEKALLDQADPITLHDGESFLFFGPEHRRSEGFALKPRR